MASKVESGKLKIPEILIPSFLTTAIVAGIIFVGYHWNSIVNISGPNGSSGVEVKPTPTVKAPLPTETRFTKSTATPRPPTPTPKPTMEVNVQTWAPKTAAEYDGQLLGQKIKPQDWSGKLNSILRFSIDTTNTIPGLVQDSGDVAALTLIDFDKGAFDSKDPVSMIYGYRYSGTNHYVSMIYNPCKPPQFWGSPRIIPLIVGNRYYLNFLSARTIDHTIVSNNVGQGFCQMYSKLQPTTPDEIRSAFIRENKVVVDLSNKLIVFSVSKN